MERDSELAKHETLEVLWSAFYQALEADLSSLRWPRSSRVLFQSSTEEIERLIAWVKDGA